MRLLVILSATLAYLVWKFSATPDLIAGVTVVGSNPLNDASQEGGLFEVTLILGEFFVFFFYGFKFNEWAGEGQAPAGFHPRPVRHFTTWIRYLGWNTAYGLMMVSAFSFIVFFPELIYRLLDMYVLASGTLDVPIPLVTESSGIMNKVLGPHRISSDPVNPAEIAPFAVMLVTVVWAGVKPFSDFEQRLRLRLQERAAVPNQARDLIAAFETDAGEFTAELDTLEKVVKRSNGLLGEEGFEEDGKHCSCWTRYARIEYLYYQLQRYKSEPVFSHLTERYIGEFNDLEKTLAKLRERIRNRVEIVQKTAVEEDIPTPESRLPTIGESEKLLETLEENRKSDLRKLYFSDQREELEDEIKGTWEALLQLIVCSVLAVGKSTAHRRDLLNAFGLSLRDRIPLQLRTGTVTMITAGTLFTVFICSVIYFFSLQELSGENPPHVPSNLNDVLWWSVASCIMHLLAIIAGYSVQHSLQAQRKRLQIGRKRLPTRIQLLAEAAWAAGLGVSVNVLLLALLLLSDGKFEELVTMWWWAAIPGVTAFYAAVYTQQDDRYRLFGHGLEVRKAERDRQILVSQATVTGLVAVFVFASLHYQQLQPLKPKMIAYGVYVAITTTLLGLALGWILRLWVKAERYSGQLEKRSNRQKLAVDTEWQTEAGEIPVRTVSVSDNGAELTAERSLQIDSEGKIAISPDSKPQLAIVKKHNKELDRYYIRFLRQAA